jgi:hypothetical protein
MVDLINVLLRAVMCIAFIMWVVRPMLMTFSRRELDHAEIEEAAQMAITSAFQAYSNNNNASNYYDNPQLAVYMAQNPDLHIPSDEELAQRQKAALEQAQADEAQVNQQQQARGLRQTLQPKTRPGFSRFCGSSAFLTASIMASAVGSL